MLLKRPEFRIAESFSALAFSSLRLCRIGAMSRSFGLIFDPKGRGLRRRGNPYLIEWITSNFQSKGRQSIQPKSLRNKLFTPDLTQFPPRSPRVRISSSVTQQAASSPTKWLSSFIAQAKKCRSSASSTRLFPKAIAKLIPTKT